MINILGILLIVFCTVGWTCPGGWKTDCATSGSSSISTGWTLEVSTTTKTDLDATIGGDLTVSGDATISGTLQASAANILGADEVMSFSDGNSIDGNKTPGYITIDDLMVTSSDTTLGNAFRVQDSALSTKFTVLSNGNVGFGTTLPKGTIDIRGVVTAGVTSGDVTFDPVSKNFVVGRTSSTALDNTTFIVQNRLGTQNFLVDNPNGKINTGVNVSIGTTAAPQAGIDVGGFSRTYIAAVQATSVGVKGAIEVDGQIYVGDLNTGGGAGTDLCADSQGSLCLCGQCL